MEKIRLANGNEYGIEGGASEYRCSMVFENLDDAVPVIGDFTEANLEKVEFLTEAGTVCGAYENKLLDHAEIRQTDSGYQVVFVLGNVDMVEKRLKALEETQNIQDEAIVELAAMTAMALGE